MTGFHVIRSAQSVPPYRTRHALARPVAGREARP